MIRTNYPPIPREKFWVYRFQPLNRQILQKVRSFFSQSTSFLLTPVKVHFLFWLSPKMRDSNDSLLKQQSQVVMGPGSNLLKWWRAAEYFLEFYFKSTRWHPRHRYHESHLVLRGAALQGQWLTHCDFKTLKVHFIKQKIEVQDFSWIFFRSLSHLLG
jgi:hypothetical protein